jgi:uncharacterized protein
MARLQEMAKDRRQWRAQDGLAHISELSSRYFKDPNDAVKGGQTVKVNMLSADSATKRISHLLKALMNVMGPVPQSRE